MNPLTEKPPPRKGLSAGGEIDSWCTRCRLDLGHRIVAMVDALPKRVVCMTCGSEHNYRAPKTQGATRKVASSSKTSEKRSTPKTPAGRVEWETRIAGRGLREFTKYSMDQTYQVDQLVTHSKFGEGYVSALPSADKVTIVFRDGPKTLAQNKS